MGCCLEGKRPPMQPKLAEKPDRSPKGLAVAAAFEATSELCRQATPDFFHGLRSSVLLGGGT